VDAQAAPSGVGVPTVTPPSPPATPFELIGQAVTRKVSRKPLLIEISKQLELEALAIGETALVLSAFQDASFFTPKTRERYGALAERTALVAALAAGIDAEPAQQVRGVPLELDDAICGEWTIAVVAPHFAACLAARDLGDQGPEMQRRFEYALTFDRSLAVAAAEAMLARVVVAR
jgi:DICT domain-containing protein